MKKMKKGFTIVELVIVIGVIAILSAILIPTFVNLTKKANDARALQEVSDAYSVYVLDAVDGYKGDYDEMSAEDKASAVALESLTQAQVYIVRGSDAFQYEGGSWAVKASSGGTLLGEYNGCSVYKKA